MNSCVCALLWLTLCNLMDCSLPGFSVHGIFQARILKWVAFSYSRGSSQSKDWTHVSWISCIDRWILYHWASWEAQGLSCSMWNQVPWPGIEPGPLALWAQNLSHWTTIGVPILRLGWCNLKCAQRKEEIILNLEN